MRLIYEIWKPLQAMTQPAHIMFITHSVYLHVILKMTTFVLLIYCIYLVKSVFISGLNLESCTCDIWC